MQRTSGRAEITIGLIDGPIASGHPDLEGARIKILPGHPPTCSPSSPSCEHGTFVAGILAAKRESQTPGICPGCTLLLRPIFPDSAADKTPLPSATSQELATAIVESIDAGARILNLSAALSGPSTAHEGGLDDALDQCRHRGVLVVAAAGNQARVGSTAITRHPWVIPVTGYDRLRRPSRLSNLGSSIGRRGLGAPGEAVTGLAAPSGTVVSGGTSVAAPFVTGAIALVWSEFPQANASDVWLAVSRSVASARRSIVPPLLDAWAAYCSMAGRGRP